MEGIEIYGKDWKRVAEYIGTKDTLATRTKFNTFKAQHKQGKLIPDALQSVCISYEGRQEWTDEE